MESEFSYDSSAGASNEWQPLDGKGSGRFRFFKARIHGRLHFVKTLSETSKYNLQSIEALKKDFEIGYNLDHPNIVRYLHYSEDAIYEEYIDGKTLHQLIEEKSPLLEEKGFIEKIARQLLEAIEYIHSKGVLHLDLKPENVMITRVGANVKIIDFGCAYVSIYDNTQGFTLEYKAPEQNKTETNAYTDIYLIGRVIETLAQHAGVSSRWRHFTTKATAENPADRFKSGKEAIAAIPGIKKWKWGYAAIAMIVAIVAVSIIFYEGREQGKDANPAIVVQQGKDSIPPSETDSAIIPIQSPEVKIENATPSPELKTVAPQLPKEEDIRTMLDRTIIDHISADYHKNVKPYCLVDTLTSEAYARMMTQMQQAMDRSLKFGESLVKRYPDQEAYIHTRVNEVISAQQSQAAVWAKMI